MHMCRVYHSKKKNDMLLRRLIAFTGIVTYRSLKTASQAHQAISPNTMKEALERFLFLYQCTILYKTNPLLRSVFRSKKPQWRVKNAPWFSALPNTCCTCQKVDIYSLWLVGFNRIIASNIVSVCVFLTDQLTMAHL